MHREAFFAGGEAVAVEDSDRVSRQPRVGFSRQTVEYQGQVQRGFPQQRGGDRRLHALEFLIQRGNGYPQGFLAFLVGGVNRWMGFQHHAQHNVAHGRKRDLPDRLLLRMPVK